MLIKESFSVHGSFTVPEESGTGKSCRVEKSTGVNDHAIYSGIIRKTFIVLDKCIVYSVYILAYIKLLSSRASP